MRCASTLKKARTVLPTVLALMIASSGNSVAQEPEDRRRSGEPAEQYVVALRAQLSRAQSEYGRALQPDIAPGRDAVAHIEQLRSGLREALFASAGQATGSESVVAANRAAAASLLEVIHAYEAELGEPPDARTTPWNVLTSDELTSLRAQAIRHKVAVQTAIDALPAAERPPGLLARQGEINSWLDAIGREQAIRESGGQRGPPQIRASTTVGEARVRYESIARVELRARISFEQHLAYQAEFRLTRNPGDSALLALRDRIRRTPLPVLKAVPKRPPPTVESAIADLSQAVHDEKQAIMARDPIGKARARARMRTDLEWLESAGVARDGSSEWGVDLLDAKTLKDLRTEYADWQFRLELAQPKDVPDTKHELSVVRSKLAGIDAEIDHRVFGWRFNGMPPEDPGLWPVAKPRPPPGPRGGPKTPAVRAYEVSMKSRELSAELLYLQEEADALPFRNAGLDQRMEVVGSALKEENALLSQRARTSLERAESELLERGRGALGAEEGRRWLEARNFEMAGDPGAAINKLGEFSYQSAVPSPKNTLSVLTDRALRNPGVASTAQIDIPVGTNSRLPIANFEELFPRVERSTNGWTRSFKGVMEDLYRAPGGVVIDTRLPKDLAARMEEVKVDTATGSLSVRLDEQWLTVEPTGDSQALRLAYAFVRDGRVMPIDLRNLNTNESLLLAQQIYTQPHLGKGDFEEIADTLRSLTAVNVHPALADTRFAMSLIDADQFIFDLLPDQLDPTPLYGASARFGINIEPLRNLYLEDFHDFSNPNSWRALFQKSILSVVASRATVDGLRLRVEPEFGFAIYRLPPGKLDGPAIKLERSSAWLQRNERVLRGVPILDPIIRFSVAASVIRTAIENHVPNNFETLITIPVTETPTPRLLCRPDGRKPCGLDTLRANKEK